MVKATLLEPQSSVVKVNTRRKERLTTAAHPVRWHEPEGRRTFAGWTLASEAKQGDEWGTYIGLGRVMTTYHGIAYGARALGRRSRHSSRRRDDRPGERGKAAYRAKGGR